MPLTCALLRDVPPRLGAAGWMVLVCVDRKGLKPQPLPPGLVEALAPHTLTTAAARAILGITTPPGARASLRNCLDSSPSRSRSRARPPPARPGRRAAYSPPLP